MPVPWDYFPPTCQGPRPFVVQGPPTTSSSVIPPAASTQQFLPDLQADSALEDEIDGFNFGAVDLGLVTDGANPGISPFNPSGIGTTASAAPTSAEQYHAYPRYNSGYTTIMHPSSPNLVSQFDRLGINDTCNLLSERNEIDTENLRSRGISMLNNPSGDNTFQTLTSGSQPTVAIDPPHRISSPPELPVENSAFSNNTKDDKSDPFNNDGHAIWFDIDSDGDTPLLLAIIHQATEQAMQMIRSVPSPELLDHRNHLQQSALHLAVLTHQPTLVRALVVTGATLDIRDRNGNTALHLCCKQGDLDSAAAVTTPIEISERIPLPFYVPQRQIPQEMSTLNYAGESCLHVAALSGHLAIVEYLLSRSHIRANPNIADGKSGRTILHYAVEARDVPLVLFLMARADVKIDCRTFDGTTALGLAMGRHYMDIANLLITAGANSDLVHLSDSESDCDCAFMEEEETN